MTQNEDDIPPSRPGKRNTPHLEPPREMKFTRATMATVLDNKATSFTPPDPNPTTPLTPLDSYSKPLSTDWWLSAHATIFIRHGISSPSCPTKLSSHLHSKPYSTSIVVSHPSPTWGNYFQYSSSWTSYRTFHRWVLPFLLWKATMVPW